MRTRRVLTFALVLTLAGAAAIAASRGARSPVEFVFVDAPTWRPGGQWPAFWTEHYRMAGRIRPLLFWISRDNVGLARIVWRRGPADALAYELLIGTDPDLAPQRLNRWGYIAEEIDGRDGRLLGIISKSEERSVGEVRSGRDDDGRRHAFSVIRATVRGGRSDATQWTEQTTDNLALHDVDQVLAAVEHPPANAERHQEAVRAGMQPGFLAAVAELIDRSVRAHRRSPASVDALTNVPVPYAYADARHDLSLRSHASRRQLLDDRLVTTIDGKFETRDRSTGKKTRFEVGYGRDGCLAGIPVSIKYEPRWWLRVELVREPPAAASLPTPDADSPSETPYP
ncbi:MAG: hypothetical protein QGF21_11105 [Vicinamibacterales bacterium]|jgi:hypothetical protein|nr:hypothetical protein [Acidobacteriota bacterium]MDP7471313.1 hypothetical protein [Vicinamibacterales bacterium]MDP7672477.1 hypothetical protein [Vicinamibacterales bacterium]HJO37525.1 hypothetical protein [Vicinamibacterales bacterium]|tara:strand:+ start:1179 stop:2201 length:1023 start_codon:yes stop_codon:yes gene_type:complete